MEIAGTPSPRSTGDLTTPNHEPSPGWSWSDGVAIAILALGLIARIYYAQACYLNPDEAMHFVSIREPTWARIYTHSQVTAHPPLFFLVHAALLPLGDSELALRLPSVILSLLAAWLLYRWMDRSAGRAAALATLCFATVSPATVSAGSEMRNTAMLLFFLAASLCSMEVLLRRRDRRSVLVFSICLAGALWSHFGAAWVALALGLYLPYRFWQAGVPQRIWITWAVGQGLLVALALQTFAARHDRYTANVGVMGRGIWYLRGSYFDQRRHSAIEFVLRSWDQAWQFFTGYPYAEIFTLSLFVAGLLSLIWAVGRPRRDYAVLIGLPFVIATVAALIRLYPFGNERQVSYLIPFAAAGFGLGAAWLVRQHTQWAALLVVLIAPLWLVFTRPANDPAVMPRQDMIDALDYIETQIPSDEPVFTDFQSQRELHYYWRETDPEVDRRQIASRVVVTRMRNHQFVDVIGLWGMSPLNVATKIIPLARSLSHLESGELWLFSVGWGASSEFSRRMPAERIISQRSFGNIQVIKIDVPPPQKNRGSYPPGTSESDVDPSEQPLSDDEL